MPKRIIKKSEDYKSFVTKRLSTITSVLEKISSGNFKERVEIPKKEDDFTKFIKVLNLTIEYFQKAEEEKKKVMREFEKHDVELENIKLALLNLTDDLNREKSKLERQNAKDKAILSCIGEGLFVVDLEGKVILINRAFENLLGWKSEEIQGKSFVDLVPAQDDEGNLILPDKRPISIAIARGREITEFNTDSDYFLIKKDKTKIPIAYKVTLVTLDDRIIGAVGVFRDVTKEKEIDRAKTEFVSLASHQLRTPLGIIKWYLEVIKDEDYFKNASKEINTYLNAIYKNNERLISLVRDLLSISRIDQGLIRNSPQDTDIIQLVKDIIKEMDVLATTKNITLDLVITPDNLPTVFVDPFLFREVIENLITNAIEYNVPFGSVKVTLDKIREKKKTDDTLLISIKDTGIGLSKKDQEKIFTKFFRSEKAISKNPNGSGLGLYVVKSYIENWGGEISVESREGKGSIFTITIPLSISTKENRKEVDGNEKSTCY